MNGLVYVGGAFRPAAEAAISVFDHGLLYGDGVFEGIRAYNGRVFKLERHIERLFDSAKAIRLEIPHTPAASDSTSRSAAARTRSRTVVSFDCSVADAILPRHANGALPASGFAET